ncbi:hypothetical protein SS50377_22528 [Spironucleus salmonicida]|uniref:Uncharacterized protein n=1 Tax=Spironucleus salmonicida TaxID=348837 RepID=V6LBZ3_9EUKA|nr:hypothetical protein SS50377_22528 [Spironucleus salmonicida]|eukprot:EST41982.1 Hypothetical protein SS50377_18287 [Spironucleus salmonicida]
MRPLFSQIQDQLASLKSQNLPESWMMLIQDSPESFSFAGTGSGGMFEFSPFLLPDLTCYIVLFIEQHRATQLQLKSTYVLIVFTGPKALIPRSQINQNLSSASFKATFSGFSIILYCDSAESLSNQLKFSSIHPSFKCTFQKLSQGFQVISSKDRKPQPYYNSLVNVYCEESRNNLFKTKQIHLQGKQLKRVVTRTLTPQQDERPQNYINSRLALIQAPLTVDISNISLSDDEDLEHFMSSLPQRKKKVKSGKNIDPKIPVTAPVVEQRKREIPIVSLVNTEPTVQQQTEKKKKAKQKDKDNLTILQLFNQQLQELQNLKIDDQKQQQQTQVVITGIEQFSQSTISERAERTKQVKQALSRAAMSYVVFLAAQKNCLEAKFADTLQKLKDHIQGPKFQLLTKVINSNKTLNTEEICLQEIKMWIKFLQ